MTNMSPEAVGTGPGGVLSVARALDAEHADRYGRDQPSRAAARAAAVPILRDLLRQPRQFWGNVARRAVQQAIVEAQPEHWLRRAEELECVGTPWGDDAARACRRHAWVLASLAEDDAELAPEGLRGVA